jgi:hypothetical protein
MLDGLEPATFAYSVQPTPSQMEGFTCATPNGRALALWLGGRAQDRSAFVPVDVQLRFPCAKAVGYDPVNGVKQEFILTPGDGGALLKGVLLRDYPLILRLPAPSN